MPTFPRSQPSAPAPLHRWRLAVALAVALVLLVAATVSATAVRFARLAGNIDTVDLVREDVAAVGGGGVNLLVVGSDARDDDPGMGDRADSMVLVHLSEDRSRIDAVQIPRDTVLDLPACTEDLGYAFSGYYGMVNGALGAGPGCLVSAVEALSGVRLDHFLELRFEGFARVVDALDGLPVDLPEAMFDPKAELDLPAGEQVLDGQQALAWARTRDSFPEGSDIGRMGNQQTVMYTIVDRVRERRLVTHPGRAYSLADAVTSSVRADTDLADRRTLVRLGAGLARVPRENISIATMPWEPDLYDPNRVVPSAAAEELFAALARDEPAPGPADPAPPIGASGTVS
ncbi:LCP family protein [Kocuria oceani]|uniref:LCP family protein n=1 Tax=Kocuria oceani TaxID=988827 RepID=A0ABV9THL9_9MICC|nr:LCP family protein [Kocuria oceani]